MRRAVLVATLFLFAGCAAWPFVRPAAPLVARADALAGEGRFDEALRVYDEILGRYPDDHDVASIRARRETVRAVIAARAETERLRREIAAREVRLATLRVEIASAEAERNRMAHELATRETELERARREIAARQAEATRLAAEADQLRSDLDDLKRIEMRIERRKP